MELPRRIPYHPTWGVILVVAVSFGACSAFMAYKAAHNTVGLVINGIITLGPAGATVFYWVISALGAGFVLSAILITVRRIASPQVLELGMDSLTLPHGLFQMRTSHLAYEDIQCVSEQRVSGQTFLYITVHGRRYAIVASLLPDTDTYTTVREFLVSQVPSLKSPNV